MTRPHTYTHRPAPSQPKEIGLPFTAYYSVEEVKEEGTEKSKRVFVTVHTEVGQTEAEEVGVEHLLRDVKDATISTLATDVAAKVGALRGLSSRLAEIRAYLDAVLSGALPPNHDVLTYLQDVFSLLPNMSVAALPSSLAVKSNDMMLAIYLAALIRSVLALHKLVDNKESAAAPWTAKEAADEAGRGGGKEAAKDKEQAAAGGKEGEAAAGGKDAAGGKADGKQGGNSK